MNFISSRNRASGNASRLVASVATISIVVLALTAFVTQRSRSLNSITTLTLQSGAASSLAFSPDGTILASGGFDPSIRPNTGKVWLWNIQSGKSQLTLTGPIMVSSVAFSPDGNVVAGTGSGGRLQPRDRIGAVWLWDAHTGKLLHILSGHTRNSTTVAFSHDAKMVGSGAADGTIRLWNSEDGHLQRTIRTSGTGVASVAFSPVSNTIVGGGGTAQRTKGFLQMWDIKTGNLVRTCAGHNDWITSVAFSPDGQMLVSGSTDKTVRLWNVQTGALLRTLTAHTSEVNSVTFSPDGKMVASASNTTSEDADNSVRIWDAQSGVLRATQQGTRFIGQQISFSPDGNTLAFTESGGTKLWDISFLK